MKMSPRAIVTLEVSLLLKLRNTPPEGAGAANATGNASVWPEATVTLAGRMIAAEAAAGTVTLAFALPKLGVLAVMLADPPAMAVTGTLAVVAPAVKLTVAGTVAAPGLLEPSVARRPPGA